MHGLQQLQDLGTWRNKDGYEKDTSCKLEKGRPGNKIEL